jgi:hypothetical protein
MNENRPAPLVTERRGTGLCGEAQADGVPCPGHASDCPSCGRARPAPLPLPDLDGILMPDGLWPTSI